MLEHSRLKFHSRTVIELQFVVEKNEEYFQLAYDRPQHLALNHSRSSVPNVPSRKSFFATRSICKDVYLSYVTDEENSECEAEDTAHLTIPEEYIPDQLLNS